MSHSFEHLLRQHVTDPILKELRQMVSDISQQQDDNTTDIVAKLDIIKAGIAGLQALLATAQAMAGTTVTQVQEEALTAARQQADTIAAAFTQAPATPAASVGGAVA